MQLSFDRVAKLGFPRQTPRYDIQYTLAHIEDVGQGSLDLRVHNHLAAALACGLHVTISVHLAPSQLLGCLAHVVKLQKVAVVLWDPCPGLGFVSLLIFVFVECPVSMALL